MNNFNQENQFESDICQILPILFIFLAEIVSLNNPLSQYFTALTLKKIF